jgi:hypothetical protein
VSGWRESYPPPAIWPTDYSRTAVSVSACKSTVRVPSPTPRAAAPRHRARRRRAGRRRRRPPPEYTPVCMSGMRAWMVVRRRQPLNSQPPAPGHPDWDGQADARRPRPWLAPGMWHPRIPLSSRMSRAARAASPVRDPPGAALTWVRRCLAAWEGRERPYQGASGRQPALSSGGGGPFAGATQRREYV